MTTLCRAPTPTPQEQDVFCARSNLCVALLVLAAACGGSTSTGFNRSRALSMGATRRAMARRTPASPEAAEAARAVVGTTASVAVAAAAMDRATTPVRAAAQGATTARPRPLMRG